MEIDDIRGMTDQELKEDLSATQRGLMNLRFRVATMQLANVHEIRKARKRIARMNTVLRERDMVKSGT